jgi:hypothetical protein
VTTFKECFIAEELTEADHCARAGRWNLINLARASASHLIESSFLQSAGEAFSFCNEQTRRAYHVSAGLPGPINADGPEYVPRFSHSRLTAIWTLILYFALTPKRGRSLICASYPMATLGRTLPLCWLCDHTHNSDKASFGILSHVSCYLPLRVLSLATRLQAS